LTFFNLPFFATAVNVAVELRCNLSGGKMAQIESSIYIGNAIADQVAGTGWFIGQFIPAALGPRHQSDVELKWGVHQDGERRPRGAEATSHATTVAILIRGALRTTFQIDGRHHVVTLQHEGDYVIYGPDIVHFWEAIGTTVVLSVRFPSFDRAAESNAR
jgi:hypothetical protein